MHTVLIIYAGSDWAYHFRAQALRKYAPDDLIIRIAEFNHYQGTPDEQTARLDRALGDQAPDLLFLLCHHELGHIRQALDQRGWPTRLLVSWNRGWPHAEADYRALFDSADHVLVNNQHYWVRSGMPARGTAVPNGVDDDVFRVTRPIATRPPRLLWCGSRLHREVKGYDRLILPLAERLRAEGVDCELLLTDSQSSKKRNPRQMAHWYNRGSVLVCASESEGTPNPALEAAACGCTLVSTSVGNMPELIRDGRNGYMVRPKPEALYRAVRQALQQAPRLASEMQGDIRQWSWAKRSNTFYDLFRWLLRVPVARLRAPPTRDLRDQITVFVTTIGAPSFDACMAALKRQDSRFRIEVIDHVAPMSAAFQQMIDRCRTPYYVQVDEDMILKPSTISMLYQRIRHADPDIALATGWLWDAHLQRHIIGVKIYRHTLVKEYPYRDQRSCEKDQIQRLRDAGYRVWPPPIDTPSHANPWSMGSHGSHYDGDAAFERYATLEGRRQTHSEQLQWFEQQAQLFLRRYREQPNEVDLMALLGVLAGRLSGHPDNGHRHGEKDFNTYADMPGLSEARAFVDACKAMGPCAPVPHLDLPDD